MLSHVGADISSCKSASSQAQAEQLTIRRPMLDNLPNAYRTVRGLTHFDASTIAFAVFEDSQLSALLEVHMKRPIDLYEVAYSFCPNTMAAYTPHFSATHSSEDPRRSKGSSYRPIEVRSPYLELLMINLHADCPHNSVQIGRWWPSTFQF